MRLRYTLLLVLAVTVLTSTAYRRRKIMREIADDVEAIDRYVDIGVTLKVVRVDESGTELIPGARKMIVVREYSLGGILDTKADPPRILEGEDGISQNPQVWFCSEDQWKVIEHPDSARLGMLAIGGMGAGKTTAGIIWTYLRWLENIGLRLEGGISAPTETRLSLVFNEIFKMFPVSWYTFRSSEGILTMADGTRIRGISTYQQSAAQGSRAQGFNWAWWFGDELQDQVDQFIFIQTRLRSKVDGNAKRLGSVTAKDDPAWRTLRGSIKDSGFWDEYTLLGPRSPFIHPNHWESMRAMTSDREYRRLVLAEDLPPESRVYFSWSREHNLRPAPLIGARKITSTVISRKTGNPRHALLIGNDPGVAKSASEFLEAYIIERPQLAAQLGVPVGEVLWWVRAELWTMHKSTEQHALEAMKIARGFGCNVRTDAEIAHVRAQPVGQSQDRPDLDVYRIWSRVGFDIKAAQYKKDGTGTGQISRDSRIEMVNALLCDARGRRRLFVDVDEHGKPVAPKLVEAFETMERDHKGRAEQELKDEKDPTDAPCALGYALWAFEKEAATALRQGLREVLS